MDIAFLEGLAEILELDKADVQPDLHLSSTNWDSLAIVSTIALADEVFGVMLDGKALSKCTSVADIEALIAKQRS